MRMLMKYVNNKKTFFLEESTALTWNYLLNENQLFNKESAV